MTYGPGQAESVMSHSHGRTVTGGRRVTSLPALPQQEAGEKGLRRPKGKGVWETCLVEAESLSREGCLGSSGGSRTRGPGTELQGLSVR
jgi:hypothetical protein